jgi:hypothetical protein
MASDVPVNVDFLTEAQEAALKTTAGRQRALEDRLAWITDQLIEFGSRPEELMFAYFNECMRLTTESRGVMGAYFLAQQLQWHIVQLIGKLHAAGRAAMLTELPADPMVKSKDDAVPPDDHDGQSVP